MSMPWQTILYRTPTEVAINRTVCVLRLGPLRNSIRRLWQRELVMQNRMKEPGLVLAAVRAGRSGQPPRVPS